MNESLTWWIHQNKNDKLDALREDNFRLQCQHDALVNRLERLMIYLSVYEEPGPRMVKFPDVVPPAIV